MVALQMLKARWLKMHRSQAAGEFCYNTLYDREDSRRHHGQRQDPAAAAILDPVAQEDYPDTVYQYPGMEKQKQCQEKSMDVNSLELEYFACCDNNCTYRYEGLL